MEADSTPEPYLTMTKTADVSLILSIFTIFLMVSPLKAAPINSTATECPIEKIEQVGDCVQGLVSTVESITKWVHQGYRFNEGDKANFRTKCENTTSCFESIKSSCPDFPEEVSRELDVICSRFSFIIDDFAECVPQFDKLTGSSCVDALIGPESLSKTTSAEKCENIRRNRKCVRKEVEHICGENMGRIIDENFDKELKIYNC